MITEKDILEVREQMQEDIMCAMDGQPTEVVDALCQIVVDNMSGLLADLKEG